ncbi:MAG: glycosyltransferase, partial [Jatrophihabitans sp.]
PGPLPSRPGAVTFRGYASTQDLDGLYRRSLCVVAPAYLEDYGLTAIEAMAYGKPLIVCEDGGNLVNFVEDGVNGFVVAPQGGAIADAVRRLAGDRGMAAKMGEAARETASAYTWSRAMRELADGVERVLST